MCKFDNQLLLCTCENKSISWKLVRKTEKNEFKNFKIIGEINIPEEFKNISEEEFDAEIDKMIEYGNLRNEREKSLDNIIINIKTELNKRYCFDKKISFKEKDVLSILIDSEYNIWCNFIYDKSKWKIYNSCVDFDLYIEI